MFLEMNGPIINRTKNHFTTRDSLGIENVATTLSRDACPVVNTVTPRPFCWAFIDWCYYGWYKNHCEEERKCREHLIWVCPKEAYSVITKYKG